MSKNVEIVLSYFKAISKGDFETLNTLMSDYVAWHQPGNGIQSGIYTGKPDLFAFLENLIKWSNGTFNIVNVDDITERDDMITVLINYKAKKDKLSMSMRGIHLIRIEAELIREVWLFSERIEQEDEFWTKAASA